MGPSNKPADWTAAEKALDRAIAAGHRAAQQEWAKVKTWSNLKEKPAPVQQVWVSTHEPGGLGTAKRLFKRFTRANPTGVGLNPRT